MKHYNSLYKNEALRKEISNALSSRIWHKDRLDEAREEIEEILTMLTIGK